MKKEVGIIDDKVSLADKKSAEEFYRTDSVFQEIIFACLRLKQLNQGARSRIVVNPLKRKNTSIAVEEVKQGLISFSLINEEVA